MRSHLSALVLGGLLATVPIFVGCGGEAGPDDSDPTVPATPAAAVAPAPSTPKPADSDVATVQATWIVYTLPG
ncbi:MAG: hypothetical protein AAF628_07950 [Planctomycetota bacterium]